MNLPQADGFASGRIYKSKCFYSVHKKHVTKTPYRAVGGFYFLKFANSKIMHIFVMSIIP